MSNSKVKEAEEIVPSVWELVTGRPYDPEEHRASKAKKTRTATIDAGQVAPGDFFLSLSDQSWVCVARITRDRTVVLDNGVEIAPDSSAGSLWDEVDAADSEEDPVLCGLSFNRRYVWIGAAPPEHSRDEDSADDRDTKATKKRRRAKSSGRIAAPEH